MTASAKPDMLINAYVEEVVRRLPMRQRSDVGFELRALLAESLRERAADAGRAPDEAMTLDLLRGFGKPDDVASRYDTAAAVIIPAAQARSFLAVSLVGLALQWAVSLPPALAGGASQIGVWWVTAGLGALWWPGFLVVVAMIAALVRRRWPASGSGSPAPGFRQPRVDHSPSCLSSATTSWRPARRWCWYSGRSASRFWWWS